MDNPFFSVVIPLYNKAHTIVKTLSTVLNQAYTDFEVVIVDDGSTDGSADVIRQNFDDKRIRIVAQENQGVSAARNRGIIESIGEWISFLDADDEWLPQYLGAVADSISRNAQYEIVFGGRMSQNYKTGKRNNLVPQKYLGKTCEIDFFQNPHVFAHISALTIRREFVKKSNVMFIKGQKLNEDFTFIFRLALHAKHIALVGTPLSIYNGNVDGQTTSGEKHIEDVILYRNMVMKEYLALPNSNPTFEIWTRYELRHAIKMLLVKHDYEGLKELFEGLLPEIVKQLPSLEIFLYKKRTLRKFSVTYINITKLIWRMHGFPVVK